METCLSCHVVKPLTTFHRITLSTRFLSPKIDLGHRGGERTSLRANPNPIIPLSSSNTHLSNGDTDASLDWESELVGELNPLGSKPKRIKRKKKKTTTAQESSLIDEDDSDGEMDWCVRARTIALKSIQSRGFSRTMEDLVTVKSPKKQPKTKTKTKTKTKKLKVVEEEEDDGDDDDENDENDELRRNVRSMAGGMFEEKKEKTMQLMVERLSKFSPEGPTNRGGEIKLNKCMIEAQSAEQVLEVASETMSAVAKGLSPNPLTPLNIATALHRIAKNMEAVSMAETHRLAFSRQRDMSMLVALAMTALPDCSPQGISNIAWALSKIGSRLLYFSEMDRLAEVASSKITQFNSQNVANLAGAFASMNHSAPELFPLLSVRAAEIIPSFREQELAQLLWAFASLSEPAEPLLAALDEEETGGLSFTREQLGSIAWSYAVFGEMERKFFSSVWRSLTRKLEEETQSEQYHGREDVMLASQVQLVNQCLKLECPNLGFSLGEDVEERIGRAGKTKRFNQKVTSSFQKEVARLLVSTGFEWVREYSVDSYTLDAVLVDKKLGLEIDGPTHFSRNTLVPLGHTMVKRRYMTSAGWKVVSLSHHEWEELHGSFEQLDYLRKILSEHLDT